MIIIGNFFEMADLFYKGRLLYPRKPDIKGFLCKFTKLLNS